MPVAFLEYIKSFELFEQILKGKILLILKKGRRRRISPARRA